MEQKLIRSTSEKMTNSILFGSGRRPTWSCGHRSVRRGIAACAKAGGTHCKHWFWLKKL